MTMMTRAQKIMDSLYDFRKEVYARHGGTGGSRDVSIPLEKLQSTNKEFQDFFREIYNQISPGGQQYLRENPYIIRQYVDAIRREPEYRRNYIGNVIARIESIVGRYQ